MRNLFKVIAVGTVLTLAIAAVPTTTFAGERYGDDRGWATVGRVLTGAVVIDAVAGIIHGVARCAPLPPPPVCFVPPAPYGWGHSGCRVEYVPVRPCYPQRVWVPVRPGCEHYAYGR